MRRWLLVLLRWRAGVDVLLNAGDRHASAVRVVVFALPGVTWEHVEEVQPPALMSFVENGAAGSMSVRTISSRTSYASGFATIGAGSRIDAVRSTARRRDTRWSREWSVFRRGSEGRRNRTSED